MDLSWEHGIKARDVMSTGPVMSLSGIDQPIPNDAFCNDRHPRTAVGRKADGAVLLLDTLSPLGEGTCFSGHDALLAGVFGPGKIRQTNTVPPWRNNVMLLVQP